MANPEQLKRLKQGVEAWNEWRNKNLSVEIDLSRSDFSEANLCGVSLFRAYLYEVDFNGAKLDGANISMANLMGANLSEASLVGTDLSQANLAWADLSRTDLRQADFSDANLMAANLIDSVISNADLSRVQAVNTNFTRAVLTGACIEDWHITSETNLSNVECRYTYLERQWNDLKENFVFQERRPSDPNRNFEPGEFTKLFQKALSTVDLIFRSGVDWQALLISLKEMRVEEGVELSVQAIENKNDGAFVVRVNVPAEADKAETEKLLQQKYEGTVKIREAWYESQLQLQGEQLAFYREELAVKRHDNTRLMGVIEIMAENQAPKYDMRGSSIGSFVDTAQAGSQQSSIQHITQSQDLTQAAAQIQELLIQLQKTGVTVETAQEQVAIDLATQAKSDPTVMGNLVGWGKTLANKAGETTLSEAVKAVVPMALKLLGIPL